MEVSGESFFLFKPAIPRFQSLLPSKAVLSRVIILGLLLGVKTREVFIWFLAILIFLGSIVLTPQWLLCIHCFTSLVSFTGFYTVDEQ